MPEDLVQMLAQFGAAGLMGLLWLWERKHSRQREQQLTEAHDRLLSEREHLAVLVRMVERNTAAIERFDRTQSRLADLLERLRHEQRHEQHQPVAS